MPFFYDPNDPNNQNNLQQQQNSGQVQLSGASPTTSSTGSSSPAGGAQQKNPNAGSSFQNLDKYLNTNNAQQFGQQVIGKVGNDVKNAQSDMQAGAQDFENKVNGANKLATTDEVNQDIADPSKADAKQFQNWENQTYSGPNSLSEAQDAWSKYYSGLNKADTSTQLLGSEPGRFTLLDSYFGRPSYNFGEKSLDNLLYQQSGVGDQQKGLQDQVAQLHGTAAQQEKQLANDAAAQAGAVEQNRNSVRSAIGLDDQGNVITGDNAGALGKQYSAVNDAVTAANNQRQTDYQKLNSDLTADTLSADEEKSLGLTPGQQIYDLNMNDYLTQGSALSKDQVMTADQRAQIQALSQLAGITDKFASGNAQDPTAAYTFNTDKFNTDRSAAEGAYNQKMTDYQNQMNSVQNQIDFENQANADELKREYGTSNISDTSGNAWKGSGVFSQDQIQALMNQLSDLKNSQAGYQTSSGYNRKI